ncbi:hypothetical protein [uncultured Desulfuromonas sp.]|uniref:hypothetical protein n=1 Tax=uncultured Desulfuromonas sp. TaxID=181013 RepID=UPI002AAB8972|nr:hypothetical protein [uncultured Desulfuromonas sp.]
MEMKVFLTFVVLFIVISFSSPYLVVLFSDGEIVSGNYYFEDINNICFVTGRSLIFKHNIFSEKYEEISISGEKIVLDNIEKNEKILHKSSRGKMSPSIVVIWDEMSTDNILYGSSISLVNLSEPCETKKRLFDEYAVPLSISNFYLLIYSLEDRGGGDIVAKQKLIDLNDFSEVALPDFPGLISYVLVMDEYVLYERSFNGDVELWAYALKDSKEIFVSKVKDPSYHRDNGWSFDEGVFVWADTLDIDSDIYFFDFNKKHGGLLVKRDGDQKFPFLKDNEIFWSEMDVEKKWINIASKKIEKEDSVQIFNNYGDMYHPIAFGGYLYWINVVDLPLIDSVFLMRGKYISAE